MLQIKNSKSGRPKPYKQAKGGAGRVIAKAFISMVVLLILFVGAGIIYTWYMGKHAPIAPTAVATPTTPKVNRGPTQNAPDDQVGVAVRMISSPIQPGSNASITIHTNTSAKCTITVTYDKVVSKDSGLVPKIADEYGMISWSWTVEPTVPYGKWPVDITCANAKHHAKGRGDLVIEKAGTASTTPPPIQ